MTQRKSKQKDVLAGRSPEMLLLRAVRRWVKAKGGDILVIGAIEVQDWGEGMNFRVAVRCTGRKPKPNDPAGKEDRT